MVLQVIHSHHHPLHSFALGFEVSPTLDPNISHDDSDDDFDDSISSLNKKGQIVFHALSKNKNACSNFIEFLTIAIESKKLIDGHEEQLRKCRATNINMRM